MGGMPAPRRAVAVVLLLAFLACDDSFGGAAWAAPAEGGRPQAGVRRRVFDANEALQTEVSERASVGAPPLVGAAAGLMLAAGAFGLLFRSWADRVSGQLTGVASPQVTRTRVLHAAAAGGGGSGLTDNGGVTLVLHGDETDLVGLDRAAAAFGGPVRAAFVDKGTGAARRRFEDWRASMGAAARRHVTLTLVECSPAPGDDPARHPAGLLRGVALKQVTTRFALLAEDPTDVPPQSTVLRAAVERSLRTELAGARSEAVAFVVTSWQWSLAAAHTPQQDPPANKAGLLRESERGLVVVKAPDEPTAFSTGQTLQAWAASTSARPAHFVAGMRSAVVVQTGDGDGRTPPQLDARLTGNGGDGWHLALALAGYRFVVLPGVFFFHAGASPVARRPRPPDAVRDQVWEELSAGRAGCGGCKPATCGRTCPQLLEGLATSAGGLQVKDWDAGGAREEATGQLAATAAAAVQLVESVVLPPQSLPPRALLVAVVSAPGHTQQREAIRASWGKAAQRHDVPVRFFVGSAADGGTDGDIGRADVVRLGGFVESYAGLARKVLLITAWAVENGYEAMFKVDDDTFVQVPNLLRWCTANAPLADVYAGQFVDGSAAVVTDPTSKWYMRDQYDLPTMPDYANGPGVLLGTSALHHLYRHRQTLPLYRVDDAAIGIWLKDAQPLRRVRMPADVYDWTLHDSSVFISPVSPTEMPVLVADLAIVLSRCKEQQLCDHAPYKADWSGFSRSQYVDMAPSSDTGAA